MNRREFIKSTAAFSAGAAILGSAHVSLAAEAATQARQSDSIRNYNPRMQYRTMGKTGIKASALGFGMLRLPMLEDGKTVNEELTVAMVRHAVDKGLNYVDTAHMYIGGQSEMAVGKALRDGYREKVYLASKMPWWDAATGADFDRIFDESRTRLQSDSIDFYLIHCVNHKGWNERIVPLKMIERVEKLKHEGKIRFSGFSFHANPRLFKTVVDANPDWDFCQVQLNYIDTEYQAGLMGLEHAAGRGLGVIVMEPLRNGFLVNPPKEVMAVFDSAETRRSPVEWAFDFIWDKPEVGVVLSGMSAMRHVEENLEYAGRSAPNMLDWKDREVLGRAAETMLSVNGAIPCSGCELCMPCPNKVAIGNLFSKVFNQYAVTGDKARYQRIYKNLPPDFAGMNASHCDGCGECVPRCPRGIDIPAELRRVRKELET